MTITEIFKIIDEVVAEDKDKELIKTMDKLKDKLNELDMEKCTTKAFDKIFGKGVL